MSDFTSIREKTSRMEAVAESVGIVPIYEHPLNDLSLGGVFSFLFLILTARCVEDWETVAAWDPRISAASEFEIVSKVGRAIAFVVASADSLGRFSPRSSKCIVKRAIDNDPSALQFIDSPSEALQLYAVRRDGRAVFHLFKRPSDAVIKAAVEQNGSIANKIPYVSPEVERFALRSREFTDVESCLRAVRKDGLVLEFIPAHLKTSEVCFDAVMNDKRAYVFC